RERHAGVAQRILSLLPDRRQRRFRASLRRIDFLYDHAVYRDSRRKVEIILDPIILPLAWDRTWNQWKHLLGAKMGIEATFVASGKYRLALEPVGVRFLAVGPAQSSPGVPARRHPRPGSGSKTRLPALR